VSRHDARTTSLRRRPARTIPATVTAVVLLALGIGLVWAAAARLAQGSWPAFADRTAAVVATWTWGSVAVLLVSLAVAVIGLVLVIAALKPGQPTALTLDGGSDGAGVHTEVVMTRRSVAKLATARAGQVDGVDSVSTVVGARRVTVTVRTDWSGAPDATLRGRLDAARGRCRHFGVATSPSDHPYGRKVFPRTSAGFSLYPSRRGRSDNASDRRDGRWAGRWHES
jgi:hypothetical protein